MKRATHKKENAPFMRLMSLLLVAVMLFGAMGLSNSVRAAEGETDPVEDMTVETPNGEEIDEDIVSFGDRALQTEEESEFPMIEEEDLEESPVEKEELEESPSEELQQEPADDVDDDPAEAEEVQNNDEAAAPAEGNAMPSEESEEATIKSGTPAKPIQRFEKSANGVDVFVYAPEGALPDKTEMVVAPVYDRSVYAAIEDAVDGTVEQILAVDISFWYGGKEIKPDVPVTVILSSALIAEAEESVIVHVDDEDNATVVDDAINVSNSAMEFDTKEFSVYSITSIAAEVTEPAEWTAVGSTTNTDNAGTQGSIMVGRSVNGANEWQIGDNNYVSNTPTNKVVSDDGKVRVQKNVIPTETENEFLVYLSADAIVEQIVTTEAITEMVSIGSNLYRSGHGNVYPRSYDSTPEEDNHAVDPNKPGGTHCGELASGSQGSAVQVQVDGSAQGYRLNIWYNGKLIATPFLQIAVPNGVLYMRLDSTHWIILMNYKNGKDYDTGETMPTNEAGEQVFNCYLTEMAYNALFNKVVNPSTTSSTSVIVGDAEHPVTTTDPMGDYIIYQGLADGNSNVTNPATAVSEPGTEVIWNINPKTDPLTSPKVSQDPVETHVYTYENADGTTFQSTTAIEGREAIKDVKTTVVKTTWWQYNVFEVVYKVKLDVTKDGFISGEEYDVNGPTVLNYVGGSVTFPVPTVRGTLYDFSFEKVDDEGKALEGAVFSLSDGTNTYQPIVTDGNKFSFTNLPWGTYTLSETTVPTGYSGAEDLTLNISYTVDAWKEKITHNEAANDIYKYENDWKIVNTKNKVTVTKAVIIPDDIDKTRINQTYYLALYGNGMYLTDGYPEATGNIICKEIRVVNGQVRIPDGEGGYLTNDDGSFVTSVTFEEVPAGTWSVWEHTNTGTQSLDDNGRVQYTIEAVKRHTVISQATDDSPAVEINQVSTSGAVTLSDTVHTGSATVTNKYAYHANVTHAEVKKEWTDYNGSAIDAPDKSVTFTLYCKEGEDGTITEVTEVTVPKLNDSGEPLYDENDVLQTEIIAISPIELDGETDTNGESAAWTATWPRLPLLSEAGHQLHYMVAETEWPDEYMPYIDQNPMYNGTTIAVYQTNVDGGRIVNRKQTTDVTVRKIVDGYNPDDLEFSFTATYGDEEVPFTLKDTKEHKLSVPVGATLTVREEEAEYYTTSVAFGNDTADSNSYTCTVAEPTAPIVFTNKRDVGDLSISKSVESSLIADSNRSFTFTITLSDENISESYDATLNTAPITGGITFTDGVATIDLKHGDVVNIIGLPAGIGYTVSETSAADTSLDFFDIEKNGDEGIITTTLSSATFTNTRKTGELEVSKTVISNIEADKDMSFAFTIAMDGRLTGTFQAKIDGQTVDPISFNTDGEAIIWLKDGQSITISDLPEGLNFRVTEDAPTHFTYSFDEEGRTTATGTINSSISIVECTNTRQVANLTIDKVVEGLMGDRNKKFSIDIEVYLNSDEPLLKQTVELNHSDAPIVLEGIPIGATIIISEENAEGYDQKFEFNPQDESHETLTIGTDGFLFEEAGTVVVTNTKGGTPDTGVELPALPFILILTLCVTTLVVMFVNRRRRIVR